MKTTDSKSRHISVWTASAFVISSMIGTGVFTSLGFQLVDIQSVFPFTHVMDYWWCNCIIWSN